ncbi:MAG: hypothetical protein DLM73_15875 [Chthoniobacterales bacterium]|nr:MAG: hypothetical protein DLM73_15875 [Chthoniobacterales bacterium]
MNAHLSSKMSPLRPAGLIALLVGAVGSLALMFHASQRTPRLLVILFTIWVVSPFLVLLWADMVSKRWPVLTRATLYAAMLVVALGSLAVYGFNAYRPPKAQAAFVYVLVPPVSWLFIALDVGIAALISRRRSNRSES